MAETGRYGTADQLAAAIGRAKTPLAVLSTLQDWSRLYFDGLGVLGLWKLPRYLKDSINFWRDGENLFFHPGIPEDFLPQWKKQSEVNGFSVMTLRARDSSVPFTFAEAEREARGPRNWIFPFFWRYSVRDGLYCSKRQWVVVYISTKILALSLGNRARLLPGGCLRNLPSGASKQWSNVDAVPRTACI